MKRPIVTLLTDFGVSDYYVGAMKGVILGICPEAQLVDITHEIAPYQVKQAAWMLKQVWRSFPHGTVHLVVVDPGVGSARRPILLEADGQFWVAPDNGVLSRVLDEVTSPEVREISASEYFRQPVSHTFHGRDIFAPVAAHLAAGVSSDRFGKTLFEFERLGKPEPVQRGESEWEGEILWVDRFGNAVTNLDAVSFGELATSRFEIVLGAVRVSRYEQYYHAMEEGIPYLVTGSAGLMEVSMNQAHAASMMGVAAGSLFSLKIAGA